MGKYFGKKFIIYVATFFVAVTINWIAPRIMPGDPISMMLAQYQGTAAGRELLASRLRETFGLEGSMLQQYITFWGRLLRGDLGQSIIMYPRQVFDIVKSNIIYDIAILVPAVSLSWIIGNKFGALAADKKKVDRFFMPIIYALISSPYFWFAIIVVYVFAIRLGLFPTARARPTGMSMGFNMQFILGFLRHWFLPFMTLFLVSLGQWVIGMRSMCLYEIKANYSKYLKSLGSSDKLIRKYAFRNGVLPQVTGFAIQLGQLVSGAILVQEVFAYPGLGQLMLQAVNQQDFYLLQGSFLTLIVMVLAANFLVDIIYMFIDPRIRISYTEEA